MANLVPAWVAGELTPVDKLEVHHRGLRHMAVSVFVMAGQQTLLQQRAAGKYHTPGLWANTCCTHPLWGEAAIDCAVRRLDEELGITGVTPVFREQVEYRADVGGGMIEHEVVDIFVVQAAPDLPLNLNPNEVQTTRWADRATLLQDIAETPGAFTPWLRIYMRDHCDAIFGIS